MVGKGSLDVGSNCLSERFKLIVFDTETTGEAQNRIIELGAFALGSKDMFCTLINPHPIMVRRFESHACKSKDQFASSLHALSDVGFDRLCTAFDCHFFI